MPHATLEAHPNAVLCDFCDDDGQTDVLPLVTCRDCRAPLCEHLAHDGRCRHRGGCMRRSDGDAVSAWQAAQEDSTAEEG